jgi:hypothetical protein
MITLHKILLLIPLVFFFGRSELFGKLKLFPNNYVGINQATTPLSRFVISGEGNSAYQASPAVFGDVKILMILGKSGGGSSYHIGSLCTCNHIRSGNYFYGSKAIAYNSTMTGYGMYGQAENASSGYNFGVYSYFGVIISGAAVYVSFSGVDVVLSQQWAGYFAGDVKVEGTLWANVSPLLKDGKFKSNILSLESSETISNLLNILKIGTANMLAYR